MQEKSNLIQSKTGNRFMQHYSAMEKRDFLFCYIFAAVPVVHFLIFYVYMNLNTFTLAFTNVNGGFTLEHFERVFREFLNGGLGPKFARSLIIFAIDVLMAPVSWATTYVLFKRIRLHYAFRVCYMIPGLMGAVIWTSLIKYMSAYDGPFVVILTRLGVKLPDAALNNGLLGAAETAFATLCTIRILTSIVGNAVVLTGAMSRVPEEIFESAYLDGCGFWREFFQIMLPLIWPTITTLLTLSLCGVLTSDASVYLYTNGTGEPAMSTISFYLHYLSVQIAESGGLNESLYGFPAAFGLILTALTIPVVFTGKWALGKVTEAIEY